MLWLVGGLFALILAVIVICIGGVVLKVGYFLCIGLPLALTFGVLGIILCVTIIGIPLGLLFFRLARTVAFLI